MSAAKPAAKASGSSGKSSSGPADDGEPSWHLGRERYVKVYTTVYLDCLGTRKVTAFSMNIVIESCIKKN